MSVSSIIQQLSSKASAIGNSARVTFDGFFSKLKSTASSYLEALTEPEKHLYDGKLVTSFIKNGGIVSLSGGQVSKLINGEYAEVETITAKLTDLTYHNTSDIQVSIDECETAIQQQLGTSQIFGIIGDSIRSQWMNDGYDPNAIIMDFKQRCADNDLCIDTSSPNGMIYSMIVDTISKSHSCDEAMYNVVKMLQLNSSDPSAILESDILKYSDSHPFFTWLTNYNLDFSNLWQGYLSFINLYFQFCIFFFKKAYELLVAGWNALRRLIMNGINPIDITVDSNADDCSISNGFIKIDGSSWTSEVVDEQYAIFINKVSSRLSQYKVGSKLRMDTPFGKFYIGADGVIYMKPYVANKDLYDHIISQIYTDPSVNGFCSDICDYLITASSNGTYGLKWVANNSKYYTTNTSTTYNATLEYNLWISHEQSGALMCAWIIWLFGWRPNLDPISWFSAWFNDLKSNVFHTTTPTFNPTNGAWFNACNRELSIGNIQDDVEQGWKSFFMLFTDLCNDEDIVFINETDVKSGITILDDAAWQGRINRVLITTAIVAVGIAATIGVFKCRSKALTAMAKYNALCYDPNASPADILKARKTARLYNLLSLGTAGRIMDISSDSPLTTATIAKLITGSI